MELPADVVLFMGVFFGIILISKYLLKVWMVMEFWFLVCNHCRVFFYFNRIGVFLLSVYVGGFGIGVVVFGLCIRLMCNAVVMVMVMECSLL